jgi:excisionase family DNA binding protein
LLDTLCSIQQAAEILGISCSYLYGLVGKEEISHFRVGKRILFSAEHLEMFMLSRLKECKS